MKRFVIEETQLGKPRIGHPHTLRTLYIYAIEETDACVHAEKELGHSHFNSREADSRDVGVFGVDFRIGA